MKIQKSPKKNTIIITFYLPIAKRGKNKINKNEST
jgi:hypothetical protein